MDHVSTASPVRSSSTREHTPFDRYSVASSAPRRQTDRGRHTTGVWEPRSSALSVQWSPRSSPDHNRCICPPFPWGAEHYTPDSRQVALTWPKRTASRSLGLPVLVGTWFVHRALCCDPNGWIPAVGARRRQARHADEAGAGEGQGLASAATGIGSYLTASSKGVDSGRPAFAGARFACHDGIRTDAGVIRQRRNTKLGATGQFD